MSCLFITHCTTTYKKIGKMYLLIQKGIEILNWYIELIWYIQENQKQTSRMFLSIFVYWLYISGYYLNFQSSLATWCFYTCSWRKAHILFYTTQGYLQIPTIQYIWHDAMKISLGKVFAFVRLIIIGNIRHTQYCNPQQNKI